MPYRHRGGVEVRIYSCFNFGTRCGGWSISHFSRPTALKDPSPLHYPFTGGWFGLGADLDRCGISRSHQGSIPGPSTP